MKLNLDLSNVASIEVLENGEYKAKVVSIEEAESAAGNPMLVWDWEILDKEFKGTLLKSWTSLQPNALFSLKNHLNAFGVDGKVKLSTEKLKGKIATIVVTKIKRRDNEDEFTNRIQKVKKYEAPKKVEMKDEDDDDDDSSFFEGEDE